MVKHRKTLRSFAVIVLCLSILLVASAPHIRYQVRAAGLSYYQLTFLHSMPLAEVLAKADASGLHVLRVWTLLGDAQGCTGIPGGIQGVQAVQQYVTDHIAELLQASTASLQQRAAAIDSVDVKASINHSIENARQVLKIISRGDLSVVAIDIGCAEAPDTQQVFRGAYSSRILCNGIIPSPQLTGNSTNEVVASKSAERIPDPASIATYDLSVYPDDSTWLPSWGQVNVYTLPSSERCVDQGVYWNNNARMSYFHNNWNSTYEQDTVFWDGQYVSQVGWNVLSWVSNFPGYYLDTRLDDVPPTVNVGVGCGRARDLQVNTYYYYMLDLLPGIVSQSYELQVDEQPGYATFQPGNALNTFSYKTHIEFDRRWVPGYYSWSY